MDKVKVRKDELLESVRANRDAHQAIYDEAVAGYKELAKAELKKHLRDVDRGAMQVISVMLPAPVNHTKDYDRVITMLEMSVDDEIELHEDEFAQYVMDDWRWKQQFLTSNAAYSATASKSLGS